MLVTSAFAVDVEMAPDTPDTATPAVAPTLTAVAVAAILFEFAILSSPLALVRLLW